MPGMSELNGIPISRLGESDTEAWIRFIRQLDSETRFMLYEPGERPIDPEQVRRGLQALAADPARATFVARQGEDIVGFASVSAGPQRRVLHRGYIVTGILEASCGSGLGTRLFTELENWARANNVTRLELTVMTHNARAIALYRKRGFEIEGTKRGAVQLAGQLVDEFVMGKLL